MTDLNQGAKGAKRAVNLTLNQALVERSRDFTSNLSATVESLLTAYVEAQGMNEQRKRAEIKKSMEQWNSLNDASGSFADEYSPL